MIPLLLSLLALTQPPLTQEELWATDLALYHSAEVWYYKAPLDAALSLPVKILSVDADAWPIANSTPGDAAVTMANLAVFHPPVHLKLPTTNPGNLPGPPCMGVCVTFSSQGDAALQALTGKGLTNFQIIEALVCSPMHPADVPAGLILQLANTVGIQTIQSTVGSAIVQQRVGLNWRAIITNSLKYGTIMALGIMSSGVFGTVSKGALFATALGHEAADDLPKLLAPGAPNPDPFLTNVLDGSKAVHVLPTACGDVLFSGVYGGPGTSFVTNPIQVMP